MPLGITEGLQETTEIGATSTEDLTLSGNNTYTGMNSFHNTTAGSTALKAEVTTSGGIGNSIEYYIDGGLSGYYGKVLGVFYGFINPIPAGNIFFGVDFANFYLVNAADGVTTLSASNYFSFNKRILSLYSGTAELPAIDIGSGTGGLYAPSGSDVSISVNNTQTTSFTTTRQRQLKNLEVAQEIAFDEHAYTFESSSVDDFNPGDGSFFALTAVDGGTTITGWEAGAEGAFVIIYNAGTYPLIFSHESSSSIAVNRFNTTSALSTTLKSGKILFMVYSARLSRWKVTGEL